MSALLEALAACFELGAMRGWVMPEAGWPCPLGYADRPDELGA